MFEVYETFLKIVQTMWLISCDFDILQLIDLKAADLDFRSTYKVFGKDDWCVSKCYKEGCKQGYGVFPWWSPFMASIKKVNILISLIMRSSYESSFNGLKTAQAWPFSRVGNWRKTAQAWPFSRVGSGEASLICCIPTICSCAHFKLLEPGLGIISLKVFS